MKRHWAGVLMAMGMAGAAFAGDERGARPESQWVMVGGEAEFDACGATGQVTGLNPKGDGFLAVRSGPGTSYKERDRLRNGDLVIMCDESGDWIGIVYELGDPDRDCGTGTPIPERTAYDGPCQSGWVHRNWVQLIAG